ncbi:hypothetical protein ULG90_05410 [Halopseudomonas pachastrellae]|nr:hypothetical protein ULG90_05410 [Halopseudomonas pachastrellae]
MVALTNGMLISQTFLELLPFGPLGAFTFAGKFLPAVPLWRHFSAR